MSGPDDITAAAVEQACHERDFEKLRQWSERVRLAELFPEETPLHSMARNNDTDGIRALIDCGFADVIDRFDDIGYTALHYAVQNQSLRTVSVLVDSGAEVNARCEERIGETPLDFAIIHGTREIAHRLLDAGADPTIRTRMPLNAGDRLDRRIEDRLYELRRRCESSAGLRPAPTRDEVPRYNRRNALLHFHASGRAHSRAFTGLFST